MSFRTRTGLLLAGAALGLATGGEATAASDDEIAALRAQIEAMQERLDELETKQQETEREVTETRENTLSAGSTPGRYKLPGTDTEIAIGGYVKTDFIFDVNEGVGDLFIPENIDTGDAADESNFRVHARQSRINLQTFTPTAWGELATLIEGDFFGGGGNQTFSNSRPFRLRHATVTLGALRVGQYWTNFMPIESYPVTVDFQGPAGIPFIRQAQIRYTHDVDDNLAISASLENSEFSGRDAEEAFVETDEIGIRAGVDRAPDLTAAVTYGDDWGLVKAAGLGRYLGSPLSEGDDASAWGVNLSGNVAPWQGGKLLGSFIYGEGVGRYIINGVGQDAFVEADGDVEPIESWGVTAQISQAFTPELTGAVAFGRYQVEETFAPDDLDHVNTVHTSLFYSPLDRVTFGGEVIWGNREDADGASDDNVRLQGAIQVDF